MTFYRKLAALWQQLPNKGTMAGSWIGAMIADLIRHWSEYSFATPAKTHSSLYAIRGSLISASIGVAFVLTCVVIFQAFRSHKRAAVEGKASIATP